MNLPILKVAIVGASVSDEPGEHQRFAILAHLPALKALSGLFEVVATCTTQLATARTAARQFQVPHAFDNVETMLMELPELDIVCVSVRPSLQHKVVMAALNAGKHVYCEHPLGSNTLQAIELSEFARKKQLRTVVGHQQHYEPVTSQMAHLVSAGYIGKPLSFNISFSNNSLIAPQPREWLASGDASEHPAWRSGHALERLITVFGDIDSVCADLGESMGNSKVDTMNFLLRMKFGAPGTLHVSHSAWFGTGWTFSAYGTSGMLLLKSADALETSGANEALKDGDLVLMGGQIGDGAPNAKVLSHEQIKRNFKRIPTDAKFRYVTELNPRSAAAAVAQTWNALASAIHDGTECTPNFHDEVKVHRVWDAVEESAKERRWVKVNY